MAKCTLSFPDRRLLYGKEPNPAFYFTYSVLSFNLTCMEMSSSWRLSIIAGHFKRKPWLNCDVQSMRNMQHLVSQKLGC